MILDGWGYCDETTGNACIVANTPNFRALEGRYPHTLIEASGEAVGLPAGQMGNSEVGHLNIGSGRVVYQDLTRISQAIRTGELARNPVLREALDVPLRNGTALHLMGLLSDGGVHSHEEHLFALLALAKERGLRKVFIHAFLDGRDVLPRSAKEFLTHTEDKIKELGIGRIATVSGRYYAMDRDQRWERLELGYRALVYGAGEQAAGSLAVVDQAYARQVTDEFVLPTVIVDEAGQPVGSIRNGDSVLFFNFRADRARELTRAFVDQEFPGFARPDRPQVHFTCLTEYDVTIGAPVAFPPQNLKNTLGEVLSAAGLRQLRIAETEKYAHVTFFFNGGVEEPSAGEERCLIPSPKVATYDLQPEMSAEQVTAEMLRRMEAHSFDVAILNFANPDMVGHTGVFKAAVQALETVDRCLGRIIDSARAKGWTVFITADHGNVEAMQDVQTGLPFTAHTTDPVPFIIVDDRHADGSLRAGGALCDIAPTLLKCLGITQPVEMTGQALF
ncbi:MAG: 2,3-bisphosphoglycerate-independent phosphoglycerate mutase [Peptococcaceae bacterium]|jgi:2,3-bisphosphoglycerate-independent phosphoglycerate mutase|nr:2,3-bisphosphoglycerate-independent phosphoglycerate mutase [Peptococcaceae bacterium]